MFWLVDDRGRTLAARNFLETGRLALPDIIRRRGFVHIEQNDRTLSITVNPSRIRAATLAATFYFIADHMPTRVAILDIGIPNSVQVADTLDQACKALDQMIQCEKLSNIERNKDSDRKNLRADQVAAC